MRRTLAILAALGLASAAQAQDTDVHPHPFAAEIEAYQQADTSGMPPRCADLFVGSSSIRRWSSLIADMRPLSVINRGFGGSQIDDIVFYFDQVVTPYHPRAIVFYAGDNDIHAGKSPDRAFADFETFMQLKTERLGATPVYVLSVKPSASRIAELPQQTALNAKLKRLAAKRRDLVFLDIVSPMLAPGHHTRDIYFSDGLHMRSAGYDYWIPVVKAALASPPPTRAPGC